MLENQTDQREVFILISLMFITFFQRARRARVIFLQRLISRRIQRRRRASFSQFLTILAWRQQRPKRVAWVLPRPQYCFETLFHSNALNMWWKENFRVSRETFNFMCATSKKNLQQKSRSQALPKLVSQHDKFRICHQRDRRRASIGRLLWDLIFPFLCFRVVVKANPQDILLFSCGFRALDDKTFPR